MNPKFILSKSKVLEQYNKISETADIVSYSSKTNNLITIILEEKTDCLFSIHLKNELKNIKDKSRVLFLTQAWKEEDVGELTKLGIKKFVVDNEPDLDVLVEFINKTNTKIELFLRLKLKENSTKTERYFVFGLNSEFVNKKIKELKNNPNIEKIGIHFHRKTQNMSEWNIEYELEDLFDQECLSSIDILNIGGGFPSQYANTNVNVINSIINKIKQLKESINKKGIKLMLEPGRFIAAPSCRLVTQIIGVYENNVIVNASVYNSDMDALIVPVKLLVEGELSKNSGKPFVIKGITPCSMDLFRYRVYLENPKVGDELVFLNAGAYNFTTDFCDLEKLETEIIE